VIASYMAFLQACVACIALLLDDREKDRLLALITACDGSASVFLADVGLFCEVGENLELVGTMQRLYDSIVANKWCCCCCHHECDLPRIVTTSARLASYSNCERA
jgi:hypothetical protein